MVTNSISLFDIIKDSGYGGKNHENYNHFVSNTSMQDIDYIGDQFTEYAENHVPIVADSIFDTVLKLECFGIVEEVIRESRGEIGLLAAMQKGIVREREEEMLEHGAEIGIDFLEKELNQCFVPEDKESQVKEYLADYYEKSGMYQIAENMVGRDFEYGKMIDHMHAFLGDMEEELGIHIVNERRDAETFKRVHEVNGDHFEFTVNHYGEIKCRKNGNTTNTCCSFHETDSAVMFADAQIVKVFGSESRICGIRIPEKLYDELKDEMRNQIKKSISRSSDLNSLKNNEKRRSRGR